MPDIRRGRMFTSKSILPLGDVPPSAGPALRGKALAGVLIFAAVMSWSGTTGMLPIGSIRFAAYLRMSDPAPPTQAQIQAVARQVGVRAAELQAEQYRLGVANARLSRLADRAEALTEAYDLAVASASQAQVGYQADEARLVASRASQRQAQDQVAAQAAADYETTGGAGQLEVMLGDPNGPQSYLDAVSLEELLAQHDAEVFETRIGATVVAGVFRREAAQLLAQRELDVRTAARLRAQVESAVARQLTAVRSVKTRRNALAGRLAAAQARRAALAAARQAALADADAAVSGGGGNASGPGTDGNDSNAATKWAVGSGASAAAGNAAANWALSQLGKPYRWGGAGPRVYDCSGLSMRAWQHAGVQLGHWTGWQWVSGPHVPLGQLQRGDLLFYATNINHPSTIHHVGIYIGQGMMVDAPYTGAYVRIDSMYAGRGLIGATRPAP